MAASLACPLDKVATMSPCFRISISTAECGPTSRVIIARSSSMQTSLPSSCASSATWTRRA
eukprot:1838785-Pleurochrysis_carterae.AAC.1